MRLEYDRVATRDEALGWTAEQEKAFISKVQQAQVQIDHKTLSPYFVINRVRYNLEPVSDDFFIKSDGYRKISANWLTTFCWRPRLGVFKTTV